MAAMTARRSTTPRHIDIIMAIMPAAVTVAGVFVVVVWPVSLVAKCRGVPRHDVMTSQ